LAITSFTFALFVLGVAVIYYLLPRRAQNYWLLISSYIFHISWAVQFAIVLAVSTLVNFWVASRFGIGAIRHRRLLWLGIGFNLAVLVVFRESNFYLPEITAFLQNIGINTPGDGLKIIIPVGLSYYTLQNISYLIDVYRGQMAASNDIVDFGLYLAYFPKILAGPIERARNFLPKLAQSRTVDNQMLVRSATLISIGLVRKILVADTLVASLPGDVFELPSYFSALELWFWLFVYAFSIYNDFAGYTSIVRGVSSLFGIELSVNFDYPYFSRSFSEFWNRWHITLSHWLRDYIYYPLSRALLRRIRARNHPANLILPPLTTMLVSGLWHGFSWHMLLWGGLHGMYLILERVFYLWRPSGLPRERILWRQLASVAVIFILVSIAWVPFRMELPVAFQYWLGMLNWSSIVLRYNRALLILPLLVAIVGFDLLEYKRQGELTLSGFPRLVQASFFGAVLFMIFLITQSEQGEVFIYQGF
jgi:alginate O-acetyltransferase complex protein AlgI